MQDMQPKIIERYFFFGLLSATFIFAFFIFRPFWVVFVLGASFSVILYPIYIWFIHKNIGRTISSCLTVLLFMVVVCGPILGLGALVFNQSQDVYTTVVNQGTA